MSLRALTPRVLVRHARPEAFVDKTEAILSRLGYQIIDPAELEEVRDARSTRRVDALIVDEIELRRARQEATPAVPIILLTGRKGVREEQGSRVVGAIKKPAGLHDLFRLIQLLFEDTPRTTPRVRTELDVECARNGEPFPGRLLSLSENGALLRCDSELPLGSCFDMRMELPGRGLIELRGEAAYQLRPDVGVVFSGIEHRCRQAIGSYVSEAILG